jgi:glycosyltransferase involved in cell wall biosynthesis
VPVLASDRGGLPDLVGPSAALPAEDTGAWTRALESLWRDPERRAGAGEAALASARARFGETRYLRALLEVYGCAP